jgi:hypothetical protein
MPELPEHLFIASDGDMFDTRKPDWSAKPLRKAYRYTFGRIKNAAQLNATLRNGENTFPGLYPMFFITSDGGALHFDCVKKNLRLVLDSIRQSGSDGWKVVATEINYEDTDLYCDDCSQRIESAYSE